MAAVAAIYMRIFLTDSVADCNLSAPLLSGENVESVSSDTVSPKKEQIISTLPSLKDLFALLKTRYVFIFMKLHFGLPFSFYLVFQVSKTSCLIPNFNLTSSCLYLDVGFLINFLVLFFSQRKKRKLQPIWKIHVHIV